MIDEFYLLVVNVVNIFYKLIKMCFFFEFNKNVFNVRKYVCIILF